MELVNQLNRDNRGGFAYITERVVEVVNAVMVTEASAAKVDPTRTCLTETPTLLGTPSQILVTPGERMSSTHVAQVRVIIGFVNVVLHTLVTQLLLGKLRIRYLGCVILRSQNKRGDDWEFAAA